MGYHPSTISELSHQQLRKLLKGERVRVKHGNHHKIMLSDEQHKKLHKAHENHKGITIQFDPYQIDMHKGSGSSLILEKPLNLLVNKFYIK